MVVRKYSRRQAPDVPQPDPVATAWRLHDTLMDWIGKVDAKASFVLALATAGLGGTALLGGVPEDAPPSPGCVTALRWVATVLLLLAIVCSAWVVAPRLNLKRSRHTDPGDYIYFGHVRRIAPETLLEQLRGNDVLPALTRQIKVLSDIAWNKHRLAQAATWLAVSGLVTVAVLSIVR